MEEQERGVPTLFVIPLIQLFMAALLFIGLLYRQRDLVILNLVVLGIVTGVRLWTRISLSGLLCRSSVDKRKVFPDENIALSVQAENRKFLPIWLQIIVPIRGLMHGASSARMLTRESSLLWYQGTRFEWDLTAQRRGVHQIGPAYTLTGDLFSFFSRQKRLDESYEIIVYPRLVPLRPFSLPRRDFFGIPGPRSPVQDPVYILGTRDYQHGQPAKYIHWKASARHDRLQEKVLESTQQEKILLLLDVDRFAKQNAEDPFERALEIVASLAARLDRRGHAVGLATNCSVVGKGSSFVSVGRSHRQLPTILEVLARVQMKSRGPLLDLLRAGMTFSWGLSCLYFTYEMDASIDLAEEYFRHCKAPSMFFVSRRRPSSEGDRGQSQVRSFEEIVYTKAQG